MTSIDRKTKRSTESFQLNYLPATVATSFGEALACSRRGLIHAYASMCRQTMQAVFADLGEDDSFKLYAQVDEIADLANIDDQMRRAIRNILFDTDGINISHPQGIDRETSVVLLETMKDVLHQAYIRRALLRQKLKMRRFFATQTADYPDEGPDANISPFKRPSGSN